jgi:hypothetical protein
LSDIVKALVGSPPALLLCVGLVLMLLGILGRSPLPSVRFVLGRSQRIVVAAIGLALGGTGFTLLLPEPAHFAIGGKVLETAGGAPVPDAMVEAHDDATSDKPNNLAHTDDSGMFYLNYGKDDEGRYVRLKAVKENFEPRTHYVLIKRRQDPLTFNLARTAAAGVPQSEAALDFAPLRSGQIVVWLSAQPSNYSSAIATSFAKDFSTSKLVEREIPRESFVSRVKAKTADEPAPDIAFIDNYAQLEPLTNAETVWLAWGEPRFATHGWWLIFKDTKHLAQAQAFVRWLVRAPGWQPRAKNTSIPTEAIQVVQNTSIAALHAVMSGDQLGLEALLDRDAARSRPARADPSAQIKDVQPILTFGNSRIAFVLLAVIASGDSFYGMPHMIFILRNQGTGWRILQIETNVQMPDAEGVQGIDANPPLLRAFDSRIVGDRAEQLPAAVLVDPPDRAVLSRFPEPPDISWQSEARADAYFIVESQFANRGDEANWSESNLTFAETSRATQPFKQRAPFGVGAQPHRWRIWTLGRSGAVSVSLWRILIYRN